MNCWETKNIKSIHGKDDIQEQHFVMICTLITDPTFYIWQMKPNKCTCHLMHLFKLFYTDQLLPDSQDWSCVGSKEKIYKSFDVNYVVYNNTFMQTGDSMLCTLASRNVQNSMSQMLLLFSSLRVCVGWKIGYVQRNPFAHIGLSYCRFALGWGNKCLLCVIVICCAYIYPCDNFSKSRWVNHISVSSKQSTPLTISASLSLNISVFKYKEERFHQI